MNSKILILGLIALLALSACTEITLPTETHESKPVELENFNVSEEVLQEAVNANNQFAFELYNKYSSKEENIFFSPYSISTALGMTFEGAKGQTAEEMREVFHFIENEKNRKESTAILYNKLNKGNEKIKLSTANALWAQKDYVFLQEYFDLIEKYYAGKVTNLDFINKTEESRKTINSWVEQKTNNKIKDLIPQGSITGDTKLVLTNAIYFKGNWLHQFKTEKTFQEEFKLNETQSIQTEFMHLKSSELKDEEPGKDLFNYMENDSMQMLELEYNEDKLSMLILLPKNNLNELEEQLNNEKLSELKNSMRKEKVNISLPKFKLETKYFMGQDLSEMGMPTAFSPSADFSGMTGSKDLMISQVIHQAFVEVNEEGTEAAAATAVIMETTSATPLQPKEFKANHPFIFIIQEKETGNILFIGKLMNPKNE
ncbi:MAG: serpin family protein [Candidatus Diapherotrites archaeon]|nr:serpin family protein [Candidatus Diapherotrites archaeon]